MYISGSLITENDFDLEEYINSYKKIGILIYDANYNKDFFAGFNTLIDANYPNLNYLFLNKDFYKTHIKNYNCNLIIDYNQLLKFDYLFVLNDVVSVKFDFFIKVLENITEDNSLYYFKHKTLCSNEIDINYKNYFINKFLINNLNSFNELNLVIKEFTNNKKYSIINNLFTYSKNYFVNIKK